MRIAQIAITSNPQSKAGQMATCPRLQRALRRSPEDRVTQPLLSAKPKKKEPLKRLWETLSSQLLIPDHMGFGMRFFLTASLAFIAAYLSA